jgi:hypothetical protein
MIFGGALLVLGLINQAPLDTIEYFGVWVVIGAICRFLSKALPNNHSGWYQT